MGRRTTMIAALGAMAVLAASGANAQAQRVLKVSPKAEFKHRHAKLALPATLLGLPRGNVLESEADQLDIMASYVSPGSDEIYTVYVTRHVAGSLPLWFDRAKSMIERGGAMGDAKVPALEGAFVPPQRTSASGLAAAYEVSGKGYRSTGVATAPLGEWLVKVRASSKTLSPVELDARIKVLLAELRWPAKMAPSPTAAPVVACTTALALSGEAKPLTGDTAGAGMLLGALLGQMAAAQPAPKPGAAAAPERRWCRDAAEVGISAVYRADGRQDGYLIAMADSGRAVSVGPSAGAELLVAEGESSKAHTVELILLGRNLISGDFDRLPSPAQAMAIVEKNEFASSFATWGKEKSTINVHLDAPK